MNQAAPILTPALLARLERLRLQARETPSLRGGARRTRQIGTSVEFAEYRPYIPGDDLRRLDWRAYARLGRLFLKTFIDERDALLYLMLDSSRSMSFDSKLTQAKQIAAALGYLALASEDRVEAWLFSDRVTSRTTRLTGKPAAPRLFDVLQRAEAAAEGGLDWLVRGGVPREPGVAVVLSDFLFEQGFEEGLRRLQTARHQVVVVQILGRAELDPPFLGDRRLIDSETGFGRDVAISPHVIDRYKQSVAAYAASLESFCRRRGMHYALVADDESLEDVIFRRLLATGVVQG